MKQFEINNLSLKGAKIISRKKNSDQRGFFSRLFCFDELNEESKFDDLKQINISYTKTKNTIRGLHFQLPPFAETKIVTCTKGKIFDVIVDLRKDSSTFLNFHNEIQFYLYQQYGYLSINVFQNYYYLFVQQY